MSGAKHTTKLVIEQVFSVVPIRLNLSLSTRLTRPLIAELSLAKKVVVAALSSPSPKTKPAVGFESSRLAKPTAVRLLYAISTQSGGDRPQVGQTLVVPRFWFLAS